MEKNITQETKIMCLSGGLRIYITPEEEEKIKALIQSKVDFFEIKGRLVMRNSIQYICRAEDMETSDRLRRGQWQCKERGHWNNKGVIKCGGCFF